MISGTLPNGSIWWISKDGKKVWIESKELEQQKFNEKGYDIDKDRIFNPKTRQEVGELTGSRLERRLYKDAWIVSLNIFLDVYPDLFEEIEKKTYEEKKTSSKKLRNTKSQLPKVLQEIKIDREKEDKKADIYGGSGPTTIPTTIPIAEEKNEKLPAKEQKIYFDTSHSYVEWIKGEIEKTSELKILTEKMKEKMGADYLQMHDLRIYFGLKKILAEVGLTVDLGKSKGKSVLIIKKVK